MSVKRERGPAITLSYTNEVKNILLTKSNNKLRAFFIMRLSKLFKKIKDETCSPCEQHLSEKIDYKLDLPENMRKDMECVCQRFSTEPATFIKRFIIDPVIANHYEEKGEF